MIKDGYEDYSRSKSDDEENTKKCNGVTNTGMRVINWSTVRVG